MQEMATAPEVSPAVTSPPSSDNKTDSVDDDKVSTPAPAASPPVPTPPASPPPTPPLSPPPVAAASPPVNSPPASPPPSSPPPPSNPPPPDSSPPLSPPPVASPPPPTSTSPPLTPPPTTQSQSPPPPELSPPPPSPPDNQPSSPVPPAASPPPIPPSAATSTPLAPANDSIQIPSVTPPTPGFIPSVQPPPDVVGSYTPPAQPAASSLITPPAGSVPSLPDTATSGSAPSPPDSARLLSHHHGSSGSSTGIIIGAAVIVGFIGVVAVICILLLKRKKRQPYYIDVGHPPPPAGGDPYYSNWNSPVAKIPPTQPGVMGAWGATPSPRPPGVMATPPVGWQPPPLNTSNEHPPNSSQQQQQRHYGPLSPGGGVVGGGPIGGFSKFQFTYEELAVATGRFSKTNLLGQGGFGYVHKGVLPDGKQVAVKSLKDGSGQGEREFQAEVEIISRVHHRHLVSLVGYCMGENQRMLVYEFVPNKTLEFHLHGKGQPVMDWATRLKIAMGAAKGLAYLHEDCHPRIIHRDIKAANILLDDNNEAMVADFGLAKLTSDNLSHISTRVMGTFGYLAPEYATTGKLTEKSDIFSFGVMLLELITGKKPVDPINKFAEDCLVDWARPRITKAIGDVDYDEIVDPRLEGKYVVQEMAQMISCAAASIRHSARRRPKMSQIVRALDGDPSVDLNSDPDGTRSETDMDTYNTEVHNAEVMKLKQMVMSSSDDFSSSEYGTTNEYSNEFVQDQSQQHTKNVTRS